MIKGAAIAAEFNPLHNGHKYIMKQAKIKTGAAYLGVVMSGCFTQRGEPAFFDKFLRTKAALLNGADIVLELPVIYAAGAADVFAEGCCKVLDSAGIFDFMVFGCEAENPEILTAAADILANEPPEFKAALREASKKGLSFPKARETALLSLMPAETHIFSQPNNILAVEYIKQLKAMNSHIIPIVIKRLGADYNDSQIKEGFSSASAVRKALSEGRNDLVKKAVPENVFDLYMKERRKTIPDLNFYKEAVRWLILKKKPEGLKEICDITEGLEHKLYNNSNFETVDSLIDSLKSKRYTRTKLTRAVLHILTDIKKEDVFGKPLPYIRVLGVRRNKTELLRKLSEKSSVPVLINIKKDINKLSPYGKELFEKEMFSADLYFRGEKAADYTSGLIIL